LPSPRGAFDCGRLLAAAAVLFSHSYALSRRESPEPLHWLTDGNATFGELAVYAFFAISGYLVTQSFLRDPSWPRFMARRLRRIAPGLVAVVCASALLIGPLVTTLDLRDYFSTAEAWTYLAKIFIYPTQIGLPGVFENNTFPVAINGSLWTLRLEFALYLAVALLGRWGLLHLRVTVPLAACCAVMSGLLQWGPFRGTPLHHQLLILFLNATPFFVGAALAQTSAIGSIGIRLLPIVPAVVAAALVFTPAFKLVLIVMLPIAVVFLCVHGCCDLSRFGDYSYGLYLWGFPIQQTVVHFAPGIGPIGLFAVAGIVTFLCAVLSWHGVEKVALRRRRPKSEGLKEFGLTAQAKVSA
jgi:peptidoglycan/LPS O-acetylase OafA/YrhL